MKRRDFLKTLSVATAVTVSCKNKIDDIDTESVVLGEIPTDKMEYRTNPSTGDKVSLLGFGAMRLPTIYGGSAGDSKDEINQKRVNEMVDFAMAHGVNYYDTSPAYCRGFSEAAMGEALSRHDRSKFFVATKLSNFAPETWSREASIAMYLRSFKNLRVDYIDYMLLHAVGLDQAELTGMDVLNKRYIDNGVLDFLVNERKEGRIRNLGFSYHGDIKVFDYLLSLHDEIHWDFVQIQMNYVDWHHAKEVEPRNTNAEELYGKLDALGIPIVIMEPLLGGQLASVNDHIVGEFKSRRPQQSVASWAFRFAGSFPRILTVLSGMTYMDHLQDNLRTYCPFEPCTDEEFELLERVAKIYLDYPIIPCTSCKYCMPCPYGLDIPTIFAHYNKMVNSGNVVASSADPEYDKARRAFLIGYDRSVPGMRQANHCIGCGECVSHCPQKIEIPAKMQKIDAYVEALKQEIEF